MGSERLGNLPKVTQLESEELGLEPRPSSKTHVLSPSPSPDGQDHQQLRAGDRHSWRMEEVGVGPIE